MIFYIIFLTIQIFKMILPCNKIYNTKEFMKFLAFKITLSEMLKNKQKYIKLANEFITKSGINYKLSISEFYNHNYINLYNIEYNYTLYDVFILNIIFNNFNELTCHKLRVEILIFVTNNIIINKGKRTNLEQLKNEFESKN